MKTLQQFKNNRLRRLLPVIVLCGLGLSSMVSADTPTDPQNCVACHDDHPMRGVHSGSRFGPTNLVADCADCHGLVTSLPLHEDGADSIVRFSLQGSSVETQNRQCLSCHEPEQLQMAHWTHAAHGFELSCSSCHSLHSPNDAVRGLTKTAEIQLCVACHSEQTLAGEGE